MRGEGMRNLAWLKFRGAGVLPLIAIVLDYGRARNKIKVRRLKTKVCEWCLGKKGYQEVTVRKALKKDMVAGMAGKERIWEQSP